MSRQNWKRQEPPIRTQQDAIEAQSPQIMAQSPAIEDRRFWPADKPMPLEYVKQSLPCPQCRRVMTDDGGRAVLVQQTGAEITYFRCRCCGHRWALPNSDK